MPISSFLVSFRTKTPFLPVVRQQSAVQNASQMQIFMAFRPAR